MKKLIVVVFLFNFGNYTAAAAAPGEHKVLVKKAKYSVLNLAWRFECIFPHHHQQQLTRCEWTKAGQPFNPHQHGFSYSDESNNYCVITANVGHRKEIEEIKCVGYFSYDTTTFSPDEQLQIAATPNRSLVARSRTYSCYFPEPHRCTWLKDGEDFDPTQQGYHYQSADKCSIRSDSRPIDQRRENQDENLFCVVYVNYNIIFASIWSIVVFALSVCAAVFLGIIVGFICKKKSRLKLSLKNIFIRPEMHSPGPKLLLSTTAKEVTLAVSELPLPFASINTESIRKETVDSMGYFRMKDASIIINDNNQSDACNPPINANYVVEMEESKGDETPPIRETRLKKLTSNSYATQFFNKVVFLIDWLKNQLGPTQ